jgi:putative ABC transport system substrate-binding protein
MYVNGATQAASALGILIHLLKASNESELDEAFASLVKLRAAGIIVPNEPFLDSQRERIVGLAARSLIPRLYNLREYVTAGGLAS